MPYNISEKKSIFKVNLQQLQKVILENFLQLSPNYFDRNRTNICLSRHKIENKLVFVYSGFFKSFFEHALKSNNFYKFLQDIKPKIKNAGFFKCLYFLRNIYSGCQHLIFEPFRKLSDV